MRIAVISDTHGMFRPQVKEVLHTCDALIHGGDINSKKIMDEIIGEMPEGCPIFIVRGNNDKEWASNLPAILEFELCGCNIILAHNKNDIPLVLDSVDIVIYGHSHKYSEELVNNKLWLNPGSCGKQRFHLPLTMAILNIQDGKWEVQRINIVLQGADIEKCMPVVDKAETIQEIFQRMDKGQSIGTIASKMGLHSTYVEEICRIRVTHPGITPIGILDKMEVNQIVEQHK